MSWLPKFFKIMKIEYEAFEHQKATDSRHLVIFDMERTI